MAINAYSQCNDIELIRIKDCDTSNVYSPYSNVYVKKIMIKEDCSYMFEFNYLINDSLIFIDSYSFVNLPAGNYLFARNKFPADSKGIILVLIKQDKLIIDKNIIHVN